MGHTVYRALEKPIMLLGIDYRLLVACGGLTCLFIVVSVLFYKPLFVVTPVVAAVSYAVCRWWLGAADLMYYPLLWDKYRKARFLDPFERSKIQGIAIREQ